MYYTHFFFALSIDWGNVIIFVPLGSSTDLHATMKKTKGVNQK